MKRTVKTINAPYFNAGIVIEDGVVIEAAPIIKYMIGWNIHKVKGYCNYKKWLTD